jgi:hypothetical protein
MFVASESVRASDRLAYLHYILSALPVCMPAEARMQTFTSRLFHYPRPEPLGGEVCIPESCGIVTLRYAAELSRRPCGGLGTQRVLEQLSGNSWSSCSLKFGRQHNSSSQERVVSRERMIS